MNTEPNTIIRLKELCVNAQYGKKKHANASIRNKSFSNWFGGLAIFFNLLIGSTLLDLWAQWYQEWFDWLAGALAFIVAIIIGLQSYFSFSSKAVNHSFISNQYRALAFEIKIVYSKFQDNIIELPELSLQLEKFSKEYNRINKKAIQFQTSDNDYLNAKKGIEAGEEEYSKQELKGC